MPKSGTILLDSIIVNKQFICLSCGSEFHSDKACKSRHPKYCSKNCYAESLKKYKDCQQCGKSFADHTKKKFCSITCHHQSRVGISLSDEWKAALSEGRKNSDKCKGENLYNWKGGKGTLSERMKLHCHSRKSKQSIKIDAEYLNRVLESQKNKCFYCEKDLTSYKAIEHLTPLSKGGDNQNYNLVYSCKNCNSIKRDKTLEEFAIKTGRFYLLDKFDFIYASSIN